jgi:GNAT superfamily N-acetyltransferase
MHIRFANQFDIEHIVRLSRAAINESRYARYGIVEAKIETLVNASLESDELVALLAVDGDDVPFGFLGGIVSHHYFADMKYATNLVVYVSPEARGSRAAIKLIREFERVAKERGADEIMLGVTAGFHAPRIEKFYNALGYQTVGALTVKYGE